MLANRRSPRLAKLNLRFGDVSPRTKRASVRRNLFNTSFKSPERQQKTLSVARTLKSLSPKNFKGEGAVAGTVIKMHDSAVQEQGSLLPAAHSIVNMILLFLRSQKESVAKEDLLAFMKDKVLVSPKRIIELYEGKSQAEKTREYEIQVLLNLEMEAASSSTSYSTRCVDMVVSLLRGMLFAAGHDRVSQFLQDTIRENYSHNLHRILIDIEEELGVPIIGKSEDSSPQKDMISSCRAKSFLKTISIASAVEERGPTRKACANQRAFSSDFHSRQIMVPSELLKKPKKLNAKLQRQTIVSHSPRLDVPRKRALSSASSPDPKKIRRNLFSYSFPTQTSNVSVHKSPPSHKPKKQALTPKGHHILKTTFVPETPLHRQGRSSVRNRQCRLRKMSGTLSSETEEVAESPVTSRQEGYCYSKE